jgi:hypothetical protein
MVVRSTSTNIGIARCGRCQMQKPAVARLRRENQLNPHRTQGKFIHPCVKPRAQAAVFALPRDLASKMYQPLWTINAGAPISGSGKWRFCVVVESHGCFYLLPVVSFAYCVLSLNRLARRASRYQVERSEIRAPTDNLVMGVLGACDAATHSQSIEMRVIFVLSKCVRWIISFWDGARRHDFADCAGFSTLPVAWRETRMSRTRGDSQGPMYEPSQKPLSWLQSTKSAQCVAC